jgi:hypothetical protein
VEYCGKVLYLPTSEARKREPKGSLFLFSAKYQQENIMSNPSSFRSQDGRPGLGESEAGREKPMGWMLFQPILQSPVTLWALARSSQASISRLGSGVPCFFGILGTGHFGGSPAPIADCILVHRPDGHPPPSRPARLEC